MARLILCADDFSFSPQVSRTIGCLLQEGLLNATSCMTIRSNWLDDCRLLRDVPAHAEIGLHLVLTEEVPLLPNSFSKGGALPGINALHRLANAGELMPGEIAAEVDAQFDRFEQGLGRPPAFVDGHQHAHSLPVIREIVLGTTRRRAPTAWVRTCEDGLPAIMARPFRGKALGSAFHSRGMRHDSSRYGLSCNQGFAGHYGFDRQFETLFPRFLAKHGERHLVMCHPGAGIRRGDPIAEARITEAAALRRLPVAELAAAHGLAFPV